MLVEAYGDHALSEATCKRWFQRFKCNDFDVRNKERGRPPKKFEDVKLQAILDEDDTLSQNQMADMLNVAQQTISDRLKAMGKIQKCGKWVPHELNERQMENRKNTCEILLQRHERKSVLHRIVTGDEKWIYFKNLNGENHGLIRDNHQHRLRNQIVSEEGNALCLVGSEGCGVL
ncbi:Mariner Mos1 transposase [Eumeta japonica]|uniref:Mariner Mos1 transposase n=1 Tax=Eumeta variegata TaxID=151549 RepID=A0A4C1UIR4_EUMVA|nr:Mariner Mos1 transposase [Eumeta japonica]